MAGSLKLIALRKRIKEERLRLLEYLENRKHQEKDLILEDIAQLWRETEMDRWRGTGGKVPEDLLPEDW